MRVVAAIAAVLIVSLQAPLVAAYSDPTQFDIPVLEAGGGGRFYTGSPAEGHGCDSCHTGARGPHTAISGLPETYALGRTYEIRVGWPKTIERASMALELVTADGRGAGSLALPAPGTYLDEEQCLPVELGILAVRLYAATTDRTVAIAPDCGASAVHLQWTAPEHDVGPVWMSGAVMESNGDGNFTGDGVTAFTRQLAANGGSARPDVLRGGCAVRGGASGGGHARTAVMLLALLGLGAMRRRRRRVARAAAVPVTLERAATSHGLVCRRRAPASRAHAARLVRRGVLRNRVRAVRGQRVAGSLLARFFRLVVGRLVVRQLCRSLVARTLLACLALSAQACTPPADDAGLDVQYKLGRAVMPWEGAQQLAASAQDAATLDAVAHDDDAASDTDDAGQPDASQPSEPAGPKQLRFSVTTHSQGGRYTPKNIGAIWIAGADDTWIRTLEVWANERAQYLRKYRAANPTRNAVDAVTSATLREHEQHVVVWDLRDAARALVPDGDYKVFVEVSDWDAAGKWAAFAWTKDETPDDLRPPGDTWFSDVELRFE